MDVGVPKETYPGERRVALVPAVVSRLMENGLGVQVEQGAGLGAGFFDGEYLKSGAHLIVDRGQLFARADILLQVLGLGANPEAGRADLELFHPGQVVIGLLNPLGAPREMWELAQRGVTAFALELMPRISRAQPMDALTVMATVAGYKAVLLAANELPRLFPMMIMAAGTINPAHVFVVGAGVAGLQAIATARRLGAVVKAYDVRSAVKEEVESLGAQFVSLPLDTGKVQEAGGYAGAMDEAFYRRQREMLSDVVADSDVVITTAAAPGKRAPLLVSEEMVQRMRPGAVIVDLAADTGGNCQLTRPGETVKAHGVTILGAVNLPSTVPSHASQMYARNLVAFLKALVKDGQVQVPSEDPILQDTLVTHRGEVVNPRVKALLH